MRKVLSLKDYGTANAMTTNNLRDKTVLGRGLFSIVTEGSRKSTVIKLTADQYQYALLCDGVVAVKHNAFPRVINDIGYVGETKHNNGHSLYIVEIEKLYKLKRGSEAYKQAKQLCDLHSYLFSNSKGIRDDARKVLPRRIQNALAAMDEFFYYFPNAKHDFHMGNFMQRSNGELVFSDPVFNPDAIQRG